MVRSRAITLWSSVWLVVFVPAWIYAPLAFAQDADPGFQVLELAHLLVPALVYLTVWFLGYAFQRLPSALIPFRAMLLGPAATWLLSQAQIIGQTSPVVGVFLGALATALNEALAQIRKQREAGGVRMREYR